MPDLVAIDIPGGAEFVQILSRAWDRGSAVLPIDQRLSPSAKAHLLGVMRPAVVAMVGGATASRPDPVPMESGDALVVATSGTTGDPKGVILTHLALERSARATSDRLGVDPARHRWLACLPLSHVGGLSVVTRSLLTGAGLTVLPRFDLESVTAASGPEVFVSLVSTALRRVGAHHFRTVLLGGSPPPDDLPSNVVTTYGLTETGSGVVYDGVPLDGVEVALDPDTSEIRLRAPMLLRAYRDGRVPLDSRGWFATGDSGRFGDDGRLEVDGRIGEMIITGGENVWPVQVENVLRVHPGVSDVAVAGRPDPEWGQRVVAWVVPADRSHPPSLGDLRSVVAEHVAPYATPKRLVIVDSLPRTSIGKVRKDLLTAPAEES